MPELSEFYTLRRDGGKLRGYDSRSLLLQLMDERETLQIDLSNGMRKYGRIAALDEEGFFQIGGSRTIYNSAHVVQLGRLGPNFAGHPANARKKFWWRIQTKWMWLMGDVD